MATQPYDLIIIGAGSAGMSAAESAVLFGKRIALVSENIGGECLWNGCVPSKALIHAAKEAWIVHQHATIDNQTFYLKAKVAVESAQKTIEHAHDNADFFRNLGIDIYEDKARFTDPHTITVGQKELKAKYFLIATGSKPFVPLIPGLNTVSYLTNETIFSLPTLPKSLAIIGGGPIGVEMAQAFHRLGTKVTILERGDRLLSKDEPIASQSILMTFQKEGITVRLQSDTKAVSKEGSMVKLTFTENGQEQSLVAEQLLIAIGRVPNIADLGLELIGIATTKKGIVTNAKLQTNLKHIFVAGDAAGGYLFTHFAGTQAVAAVRNSLLPFTMSFSPKVVPWTTFTDPEVAHVGLTEDVIKKQNRAYQTVHFEYTDIDRAVAEHKPTGFIHLFIASNQKLLGAQIVGERAGELIHEIALAIAQGLTVNQILSTMHVYPTYSLGIQQSLLSYVRQSNPWYLKAARILARFR